MSELKPHWHGVAAIALVTLTTILLLLLIEKLL